jgi:hypothetical protein
MANILQTITNIFESSIQGEPPPPAILQNIGERLNDLMAVSADASGDGINRWLAKLRELTTDTRLHETLLVRTLQMKFTRAAELLTLLGIIKFKWDDVEPPKPVEFSIDWSKLNKILSNPGDEALILLLSKVQAIEDIKALQVLILMLFSSPQALLELEYKQAGFVAMPVSKVPGIDSTQLTDLIEELVNSPVQLPLAFDAPLTLDTFTTLAQGNLTGDLGKLVSQGPDDEAGFNKLSDFSIEALINTSKELKPVDLGEGWKLSFTTKSAGNQTFKLHFTENGIDPSVPSTSQLGLFLSKTPAEGNALLVGEQNGTHFSIQSIGIGLNLNSAAPIFDVAIKLDKINFALKPDFLKFLSFGLNLPTVLQFQSDVALSYVQGKGLSGQGGNGPLPALGIDFTTPLNLKIGASGASISVDQVSTKLEVKLQNSEFFFQAIFRYGATAEFGPLKIVMDGAGVSIGRWTNGNGGLLPPQGIGVALDAGPVNGGGFLKFMSDNEFGGAFQLKILGIGAFAYCLYKTLPTGEVSFVALIGVRLPPPGIQISFGFAVSGFGGLVGINRRADTDIIRERLATGAGGDVLFNSDPMKNAPKLLGDMQLFFPDQIGGFIIGPTLQINWLYIIKLDVGVFIQLPGPVIFIAGSAKLVIGSEEFALVYLRMDFIGGLDVPKSLIFFDAVLVNSHVLGIFRITGGVALRIAYGENGYFLFSVGGFHPSFNPGSMELPRVPRVGVSYSLGPVWLKKEMYLAITSNTFQLGSRVEAGIEIGPISAHGWFGFDALIQFKPFQFVGTIDAGFDVEVAGTSLCSVRVEGLLSGPGPLVLQARASVKILFVRISGDVTIELSSNPPENVVVIPNIPQYLKDEGEIKKPDNLRAEGTDNSVIFAAPSDAKKLFAPVGEIIWEQKRVPLNLAIQKFEGVALGAYHNLRASTTLPNVAAERDWFGVGTYLQLADSEALNNPRFSYQESGIRIGAGAATEGAVVNDVTLEITLVKLPDFEKFLNRPSSQYINGGLASLLGERSGGAKLEGGKAQVTVVQEKWNAHKKDGTIQNVTDLNAIEAFIESKQMGGVALPVVEQQLNLTGII